MGRDGLLEELQSAIRDFPPSIFLQRVTIIDGLLKVATSISVPGDDGVQLIFWYLVIYLADIHASLTPIIALQLLSELLRQCYDYMIECSSSWSTVPMQLTDEGSLAARMVIYSEYSIFL